MGDRANVVMRYERGADVYLYTHWGGCELPATLQAALKRQVRWNDSAYLARIIFCEMIKGHEGAETGFGIAPTPCDNEHDWLVVNVPSQTVERHKYSYSREDSAQGLGEVMTSWTFEEFVAFDLDDYDY